MIRSSSSCGMKVILGNKFCWICVIIVGVLWESINCFSTCGNCYKHGQGISTITSFNFKHLEQYFCPISSLTS